MCWWTEQNATFFKKNGSIINWTFFQLPLSDTSNCIVCNKKSILSHSSQLEAWKKVTSYHAKLLYFFTLKSHFIQLIVYLGCSHHNIEPVGCFHDDMVPPRPVPNYVMNERDYTHHGWNGILIDWQNWVSYSPEMICRCADAASKRNDDYFAIQFWGKHIIKYIATFSKMLLIAGNCSLVFNCYIFPYI